MYLSYAMCIIFTRIYLATRDYVREQTAALLPLANDEEHLPSDDAPSISPKIIEHPDQLLLLIFASFIHIIGNIFTVIFSGDGRAYIVYSLSYSIAFPCYALYIYFDTHCTSVIQSKRILLPDTSWRKVITIALWTLSLTLLTIRLGFLIGSL
ncbi:hypothetical protein C2G38_2149379 [Gigaspora rosea]|uniref:Uncharacterized protein n=1 Tax=Gigaspora rosea TaxID=44941 RepID=A0A397U4Q1_9GLOM|nr:hypothetical protein C2G38_2149379 [Gigaspora rosea]